MVTLAGRDQVDDAPDQDGGLAGARAGLDEERAIELGQERRARVSSSASGVVPPR